MIRGDPNDFSVSSPRPTQSASILGGPGGDDGRLLRRREGFPGEMAQATPDVGARQGSRGQKRRVAQRRGRGGVFGLVRLGAFLAALPRAMDANHGGFGGQRLRTKCQWCAHRVYLHDVTAD